MAIEGNLFFEKNYFRISTAIPFKIFYLSSMSNNAYLTIKHDKKEKSIHLGPSNPQNAVNFSSATHTNIVHTQPKNIQLQSKFVNRPQNLNYPHIVASKIFSNLKKNYS